jgi:hypothetical protein
MQDGDLPTIHSSTGGYIPATNKQDSTPLECSSNGEQSTGATGRTPSSEEGRVRGTDIKVGKR